MTALSRTVPRVNSPRDEATGELERLGWVPDFRPILSSGESRGWGWCKPSMFFRLTSTYRIRVNFNSASLVGEFSREISLR